MFEIIPPPSSTSTSKPKNPDPDEALVEAWVNRGDAAAFERIVEQYQGYVFRLALSVLGPGCEGDAQDVTQEVFVRIAGQLQHFRGESRFRTWLHRLALNMAFNCRRRPRWRKPHVDASILDHRPAPGGADDPYLSAAAAERRRVVSESLDALPDSLRTVIHLHYWLDVPVEGIASMLRMPAGTVKSHLHRGRKLLFKAMQARGLHPADQGRFAFSRAGEKRVGDVMARQVGFQEEQHPTLIRAVDDGADMPAAGTLWIDPGTGEVVRAELRCGAQSETRLTVTYRRHPKFGLTLPVQMVEKTLGNGVERVEGTCNYANFRRFETSGRILPPKAPDAADKAR